MSSTGRHPGCAFISGTSFGYSQQQPSLKAQFHHKLQVCNGNKTTTTALPKSIFYGSRLRGGVSTLNSQLKKCNASQSRRKGKICMLVDPWSVSPETVDQISAQLFAVSLFPYLTFLYFLNKAKVDCPPLVNFGFRFLLVFVFATIPAGIYAKIHYHDILANIDWLHGSAESLLTITNIFIVLGFRNFFQGSLTKSVDNSDRKRTEDGFKLRSFIPPVFLIGLLSSVYLSTTGSSHLEPGNALSFPTWIIHVSSVIEWLVAMGYVWQFSEVCQNPKWKGLTWGMLPLHTSSICACTYHLFYNPPALNSLVALQAFLTCVGNGTMALAAYRISMSNTDDTVDTQSSFNANFDSLASKIRINLEKEVEDPNATFFFKLFSFSALISIGMKWGSLFVDFPFEPSLSLALAIIITPSILLSLRFMRKSKDNVVEGAK